MYEYFLLHKLRILVGTGIMLTGLVLLVALISTAARGSWHGTDDVYGSVNGGTYDGPNVVSGALSGIGNALVQAVDSVGDAGSRSAQSVETAFSHGIGGGVVAAGKGVGNGFVAAGRGVGSGFVWTGRAVGSGFAMTFRVSKVAARASMLNTQAVASVIRPADHTPVPIIDPASPELQAARAALPATAPAAAPAPQPVVVPQWPLHGAITTQFGASDWPYQRVHTGIDISDGTRPGTTPIHPFRPGTVVQVIHSTVSLGNHVVVDHGNGVTSVYGHMNSTAVVVGQQVDEGTVLGYEGTTGASTGTHLHFEIRVNGQATDPHQFIAGQP